MGHPGRSVDARLARGTRGPHGTVVEDAVGFGVGGGQLKVTPHVGPHGGLPIEPLASFLLG